jgi:hypothetical protein
MGRRMVMAVRDMDMVTAATTAEIAAVTITANKQPGI